MDHFPHFVKQKHTATKAGVATSAIIIYGVEIRANGGNVDVQLIDAATDTGSDDLDYSILDGDTRLFDYTPFGGVMFATGLSLTTTSNAVIQLWTSIAQITA